MHSVKEWSQPADELPPEFFLGLYVGALEALFTLRWGFFGDHAVAKCCDGNELGHCRTRASELKGWYVLVGHVCRTTLVWSDGQSDECAGIVSAHVRCYPDLETDSVRPYFFSLRCI